MRDPEGSRLLRRRALEGLDDAVVRRMDDADPDLAELVRRVAVTAVRTGQASR